ncbi:YcdB/YcdC domain-containing protein, partial [Pelotomaculum sp. PtaB.Bin117]|uniref:YcdB/YcdC domain-containing protein n=1 Tax=Pelotomaculum sp. PtaB.Bin117 TaxID=1811694 RepID=UPI00257EDDE3
MKRVKGAAAVVLAVSMLLSTTAWAAEKEASGGREAQGGTATVELQDGAAKQPVAKTALNESQRQALEKIYQIVPELKELSVEGVSEEGEATWKVFLSDRAGDTVPGIMRIRANLTFATDTGELLRFDIRNPSWASAELPASGLAKEKAAEFARRVLGDKMKDYQMNGQISYGGGGAQDSKGNKITWASAHVQFERLVNGIPLLNNGMLQVGIDAAGHVTEYYIERYHETNGGIKGGGPDPAAFPDPALAVTKEAAAEIFAGSLEMKLNYVERQPRQYPKLGQEKVETRPVLIYTPIMYTSIDAVSGKPLDEPREQSPASLIKLAGEGGQ